MAYQGGNLKSTSINGVKLYTVSGSHRSAATWLPPKKQRALRKNPEYQRRVDLIQDLRFETATTRIKATPDGEYLIASGIYPPQIKVYELKELSLKFERHFVSEIINFQVLDDDYSKIAFLCADRSICLHAKYGRHYSLRIPRMGRDIAYDCWSCDIICAASSPDLYRINLEQGRFLSSLNTQSPALNVVSRSNVHGLVAGGGEDGAVECFDMRTRSSIGRIDAVASAGDINGEVTAIEFGGKHGFFMAVGSSGGKVLIYDLRKSYPVRVKDHMYGSPILNIKWHKTLNSEGEKLITTDEHTVRIWDPQTGEGMTSIEPTGGKINDLCVFKESGLMLLALDSSQIPSYFIPDLGPAPKWCSYIENLTEELEENAQTTIYDDYKFLTKEDLVKLNLTNLIGTNLLRAYMHGFFIDYRLYQKAKDLADPFAYESYIEKRKQEKLEALRASRITLKKRLPKVNRNLAARLLEEEEAQTEKESAGVVDTLKISDVKKTSKKKKGLTSEVFKDERFTEMFENKDFEIDEFSPEYLALHPNISTNKPSLLEEHFETIMEEDQSDLSDSSEAEDDNDNKSRGKLRVPRFYEMKDGRHAEAFSKGVSLAEDDNDNKSRGKLQMTMRCMQALVRVQARVRARRLQLAHNKLLEEEEEERLRPRQEEHVRRSPMNKLETKALERNRGNEMKRERALAYAFGYQQRELLYSNQNGDDTEFYDHENMEQQWGWNWLEQWKDSQPYNAKNNVPWESSYVTGISTDDTSLGFENAYMDRRRRLPKESSPLTTLQRPGSSLDHIPSFMVPTQSAKAKVRGQVPVKQQIPPGTQWNSSTKGWTTSPGYMSPSAGGGKAIYQAPRSPNARVH